MCGPSMAFSAPMTAAKSSMSQNDMAGCSMHMSKAMKMTAMKPKKM